MGLVKTTASRMKRRMTTTVTAVLFLVNRSSLIALSDLRS
jgi:hypothetical protein